MELLVEPVLRAVNQLHIDSQISAMTLAIAAFCEAWSSNILARKIRFRYVSRAVATFEATEAAASVVFRTVASLKFSD